MLQQLAGALNDTKVSLVVVVSMSKQEHVMQATREALSKGLWVRCIEFQPKCTKEHWQAAVQHRSISNGVDPSTELFKKTWMPVTCTGLDGHPSDWGYTELVSIIQTDLSGFRPIQAPVPILKFAQVNLDDLSLHNTGLESDTCDQRTANETAEASADFPCSDQPPVSTNAPEDLVQRLVPLWGAALQKKVRNANKHWVKLQGYKQKLAEGTILDESQLISYQGLKKRPTFLKLLNYGHN